MKRIQYAVLCLMLVLAAGCQGRGTNSPEAAAAAQVNQQTAQGLAVDPQSMEIAQKQEVDVSTFVVVAFNRQAGGRDERCVSVVETHRQGVTRWVSRGDSTICLEAQPPAGQLVEPMAVMGGMMFGMDAKRPDLSYALGMVNDPVIVLASVAWEDGQLHNVPVVSGTLLAVREGEAGIDFITGLDAAGNPVFTVDQ